MGLAATLAAALLLVAGQVAPPYDYAARLASVPRAGTAKTTSPTVDARLYPAPPRHAPSLTQPLRQPPASEAERRLVRGLVGGLLGAAAGVVTCTGISNAIADEGAGFSTCTSKGNLLFAGGGFALGFLVGWLTGDG